MNDPVFCHHLFRNYGFLFLLFLSLCFWQPMQAQTVTPTQTDDIPADNGNNQADPGETIRYKVDINNTGSDANGLQLNAIPDMKTTLVPGSFRSSPLAMPDSYTCTGNVGITVPASNGVLANDFDDNIAGLTITAAAGATNQGGLFALASDGSFSYQPPAGFTGVDQFTYTLEDGNEVPDCPPTDEGTVTITVSNLIWFVDNTLGGSGGDGRLATPFQTLADFNSGSTAAGDVVYVEYTGTTYDGGIVLQNDEKLFGKGHTGGTNLADVVGFSLAPFSNTLPAINGTRPLVTNTGSGDGIQLASGNTVQGLNVGNCADFGMDDNGAVGSLNVSEVNITNNTGGGFRTDNGGTLAVSLGSLSAIGGVNGVDLDNCSGSFRVSGTTSVTNSIGTAVSINNNTATVDFAALDITNTSSNQAGLFASGGIINTTSGTINTGSGRAIDLSNADLGITLTSIQTNGANSPIILNTTAGSFEVLEDSNLLNCSNRGISIDDAAGTVTFDDVDVTANGSSLFYGIRIDNSGSTFSFASTDISGVTLGTSTSFNSTTGFPINDGNGDGIFLKNNTGSFTTNGGTFLNIGDNAIDFRNTNNIVLDGITVGTAAGNSSINSAISGTTGTNLTLRNSTISFVGDDVNAGFDNEDNGMELRNLAGTLVIENSTFDTATGFVGANAAPHSASTVVDLVNVNVNLNVTVMASTFRKYDFEGLSLRHSQGTLNINIGDGTAANSNTFELINGAAIDAGPNLAGTLNNCTTTIDNNQFTTVGIAANVFSTSGGITNATFSNNTVTGTTSDALRLIGFNQSGGSPNAQYFGLICNNNISGVAANYPGQGGGSAFFVAIEDNATSKVVIDGNIANATGTTDVAAILTTQHQRGGDLDILFSNNQFENFSTNFFGAVFVQVTGAIGANDLCIKFDNNSYSNTNGLFGNTYGFDVTVDGGNDFLRVDGFPGGDETAMSNFLNLVEATGPHPVLYFGQPSGGTCDTGTLSCN